jgi:hypothetical protein
MQYISTASITNVMNFLLNLLRIKCLYMFRALFVNPQKALHNRRLVYFVRVMSVGCIRITRKQYNKCRLLAPLEDEQVMIETCKVKVTL